MRKQLFRLVLTGMVVALVGCGGSTSGGRMSLNGKVSYQGRPVAGGQIYFKSLGDKLVYGGGIIKDGVYQTSPNYGPIPGRQEVRVVISGGSVSDADRDFFPHGKATAPDQVVEIDLAPGTKAMDFDLPAEK